jgi:hypothetical protein
MRLSLQSKSPIDASCEPGSVRRIAWDRQQVWTFWQIIHSLPSRRVPLFMLVREYIYNFIVFSYIFVYSIL